MLSLAFVRYDDGDLDPYREIAVAFLVADPEQPKNKGAYIHRLPVDQEFTCAAGRDIWGFPKFVTPIEINEELRADRAVAHRRRPDGADDHAAPRAARADALDRGRRVLVPRRRAAPHAWELRGSESRMRLGGARVELGTGEIADELRSLGLPKRALMSGCIGEVAMTFQAAEVVGAARPTRESRADGVSDYRDDGRRVPRDGARDRLVHGGDRRPRRPSPHAGPAPVLGVGGRRAGRMDRHVADRR